MRYAYMEYFWGQTHISKIIFRTLMPEVISEFLKTSYRGPYSKNRAWLENKKSLDYIREIKLIAFKRLPISVRFLQKIKNCFFDLLQKKDGYFTGTLHRFLIIKVNYNLDHKKSLGIDIIPSSNTYWNKHKIFSFAESQDPISYSLHNVILI